MASDATILFISLMAVLALAIPIAEILKIRFIYIKYITVSILVTMVSFLVLAISPSGYMKVNFMLNQSPLISVFDIVTYVFMIAVLLGITISILAIPDNENRYSYLSLALVGSIGSILLSSSIDPVMIIASWTLISVASFSIIALARDRISLDSSLRYSVVGSVATQLLLIGIIVASLTIAVQGYSPIQATQIVLAFSIILALSGIGFKLGSVPFHMWVPDVYGRALPLSIGILVASIKLGAIALLVRLALAVPIEQQVLFPVVAFMSVASMLIGSIAPLTQNNVQKIIAYSSIAHIGFILIGITVIAIGNIDTLTFKLAIAGIAFHTIAYAISKSGLFAGLNYIYRNVGSLEINDLASSTGKGVSSSILKFGFLIHIFNLIGVPPLPGFWGKLFLFLAAAQDIDQLYISGVPWLTLIGIIASVISIYYYINIARPILTSPLKLQSRDTYSGKYVAWDLYSLFISSIVAVLSSLLLYRLLFIL